MTATAIEVIGGRELQRALLRAGVEVDDLKDVHLAAAQIVEARAEDIVPVATGELRDTIRATGQKGRGVVRAGMKRTPYAGPIHFGWPAHNIEPDPFLYDALDQRAEQVVAQYERRVRNVIRNI